MAEAPSAHRIETHPEKRRVQVNINGATVADSERRTTCPFKGDATHFSVGGEDAVAWSYEDPIEQVAEIRGLVAFYNERVDLKLD